MTKEQIVVSWSGGKDSSLARHRSLAEGRYDIADLVPGATRRPTSKPTQALS